MGSKQEDQVQDAAAHAAEALGDFTADRRLIMVAAIAVPIGAIATVVARLLLDLIAFFTNVFFYGQASLVPHPIAGHHLGAWVILVPVVGSMIVGLMAYYGSERIRGHGIPEAIEAILLRGSAIQPRVALLKPLSTAISIGCGGPFGAEGPIIMTGGAFGSIVAQLIHLTSAERRALLVAGASAGMCAVFNTPLAAILLAVELLLFEWKPRSFVPVALASATAAGLRPLLVGTGALFPSALAVTLSPSITVAALIMGVVVGALAALLTASVYAAEDFFHGLPFHWMWWPALGGLAIGIGGYFVPESMGVGYDIIERLTHNALSLSFLGKFLIAKWLIWSISLGSGTSGGVLAPLLLMGGSIGCLLSTVLPHVGAGFWSLIGMGAIMGGTMRSPLTGIVFIIELTHNLDLAVPLLIAVTTAHAFTVLVMRRSILTEKLSRRGFHLSREYEMDPLEIVFVREAMHAKVVVVSEELTPGEVNLKHGDSKAPKLYPVVDPAGALTGVVTRADMEAWHQAPAKPFSTVVRRDPVVAYPDEPLKFLLARMAKAGVDRVPVVSRGDPSRLVGLISLTDVMEARRRILDDEGRRSRTLPLGYLFAFSKPVGADSSSTLPVDKASTP